MLNFNVHLLLQFSSTIITIANCQIFPPLDLFLTDLLNVTTSEIQSLANNFNLRDVSPQDIKFLLHTPNDTIQITPLNRHLINPAAPTKILIHGWQVTGADSIGVDMARAYHTTGPHNFIAVDWSDHSKKIYTHASSSTKQVGDAIGDFVLDLVQANWGLLERVHLIGHSLGGHVAGFAGKRVARGSPQKVGRITGLDVAAPMFEVPRRQPPSLRLCADDADFVDVVHTNAGFLGVTEPLGTADFYVENGGPVQPGCFDLLNVVESFACSHMKAFEYYHESVMGRKFEAVSCPNSIDYHILLCLNNKKSLMGENIDKSAKGTYYLEADSALPYSRFFDTGFRIKIETKSKNV